jgi:hypothetical protein
MTTQADRDARAGKRTIERPWLVLVRKADPERSRDLMNEPEYEFRARTFRANRSKRGAYDGSHDDSLTDETGDFILDELGFAIDA